MHPRGSGRAGGAEVSDADVTGVADVTDVTERTEVDRPEDDDGSDLPWAAVGVVVLVLVTGAFASGWHLGRRWGRLMGW